MGLYNRARCCELILLIYLQTENFFNTFKKKKKTGETKVHLRHKLVIMISAIINILLLLIFSLRERQKGSGKWGEGACTVTWIWIIYVESKPILMISKSGFSLSLDPY